MSGWIRNGSYSRGPLHELVSCGLFDCLQVYETPPEAHEDREGNVMAECRHHAHEDHHHAHGHQHGRTPAAEPATYDTLPEGYEGTIWTCPMHPQVRRTEPGQCPICGMALEPLEPAAEEGPNPELIDMSRRFWVSAVSTVPLVLLVMAAQRARRRPSDRTSAHRAAVMHAVAGRAKWKRRA